MLKATEPEQGEAQSRVLLTEVSVAQRLRSSGPHCSPSGLPTQGAPVTQGPCPVPQLLPVEGCLAGDQNTSSHPAQLSSSPVPEEQ